MSPQSCSHFENSPLAASGMRHARVRIRKLVKLGTMTSASRIARHFSRTLNARKYATGNPMTKHNVVAMTAILIVVLNTWKKRRAERVAVVLQRLVAHVDRHTAAEPCS